MPKSTARTLKAISRPRDRRSTSGGACSMLVAGGGAYSAPDGWYLGTTPSRRREEVRGRLDHHMDGRLE
jgi:hypothetical protein